jgi:hypothetical protein
LAERRPYIGSAAVANAANDAAADTDKDGKPKELTGKVSCRAE